jgi:hypothetical protein
LLPGTCRNERSGKKYRGYRAPIHPDLLHLLFRVELHA